MRYHVDATILDAASVLALAMSGAAATPGPPDPPKITTAEVAGLWCSADGAVKLTLKTDGTYAGEVAGRRRHAHGTYRIDGATMTLDDDDSGLRTLVALHGGKLEMAGHRLRLITSAPEARPYLTRAGR
jgi:putative ligand-binding protein with streptavidin-like fold